MSLSDNLELAMMDKAWVCYYTSWNLTMLHISLSERDVLRLVRTLSLPMSTLSLDILPNRREHQSMYKITSAMDDLEYFTIPTTPRLYSKESDRILCNRPIS